MLHLGVYVTTNIWFWLAMFQTGLVLYSTHSNIEHTNLVTKINNASKVNAYKAGCFEAKKDNTINCTQRGKDLEKVYNDIN